MLEKDSLFEEKALKRREYAQTWGKAGGIDLKSARAVVRAPDHVFELRFGEGRLLATRVASLLKILSLGDGPGTPAYFNSAFENAMREGEKVTVRNVTELPPARRRKAAPRAVALLDRFKDVPSVDPHLFRADLDRVLDPDL
jgi:hypothetical protein